MKRNKESTGNTWSKEGKRSTTSGGSEGIRMVQEAKGVQGVERVMGGKEVRNFFVRY